MAGKWLSGALCAAVMVVTSAPGAAQDIAEPDIQLNLPQRDLAAPIAPGDTLSIQVEGEADLSQRVLVQPGGRVFLRLAGSMVAQDKVLEDFAAELQARLSRMAWSNRAPITGAVTVERILPGISLTNAGLTPDQGPRAIRAAIFAGDAAAVRAAGGSAEQELEALTQKATREGNAGALAILQRFGRAVEGSEVVQSTFGAVDPNVPGSGGVALLRVRGGEMCDMVSGDLRRWLNENPCL